MTQKEIGQTIMELRKQAGFTQKSLAETLNVTDKAVSKWERGLSCPDISLLPKLSALLDADIEAILAGVSTIRSHFWKGILFLNNNDITADTLVYDKPMVYYLLSCFMLSGISEILIVGNEENIQKTKSVLACVSCGLEITYSVSEPKFENILENNSDFIQNADTFILTDEIFLFAASFTRQLHFFMSLQDPFICLRQQNGENLPVFFISEEGWKQISQIKNKSDFEIQEYIKEKSLIKTVGRGTICIPMNTYEQIADVSSFVKMFQTYQKQKIADLKELAINRSLIEEKVN